MREHWSLSPGLTFLNHGSYGAVPKVVRARQTELRDLLDHDPIRFFEREYPPLFLRARDALARFIDADASDVVLLSNVTAAVNTVLRNLRLSPGDELVTTTHTYNACRTALDYVAETQQARIVCIDVPFPIASAQTVIDRIEAALTSRTRLVFIDHITSPTGIIFPIEQLIALCNARSIETLIDGAHAPGMVPLSLRTLGATYYAGNCHKWMCAPQGAAFLHVQRDKQEGFRPLVISHGANAPLNGESRFEMEFALCGTGDLTPILCIPEAIETIGEIGGGWPAIYAHNRALALQARALLMETFMLREVPAPDDMIGAMVAFPLDALQARGLNVETLHDVLLDKHKIQVPISVIPTMSGARLRISAQLYNTMDDYARLREAMRALA